MLQWLQEAVAGHGPFPSVLEYMCSSKWRSIPCSRKCLIDMGCAQPAVNPCPFFCVSLRECVHVVRVFALLRNHANAAPGLARGRRRRQECA